MRRAAIVGIAGPHLLPEEADLFRAFPPAGVILFARNVQDPQQVAQLMGALRKVLPPDAELMVDQEGGRVARLRAPHWRSHPAAAVIGQLFDRDAAAGLRAAWLTGALIGEDCRQAGFTVVAAPVLDLAMPGASDVVGDRAFGHRPADVARLGREVARGLLAAGVVAVGKHIPGHGRAVVDSHLALPRVTDDVLDADLEPFALNADLPWMMTAHIVYQAFDQTWPATLSAAVIEQVIRGRIGYKGVLVTDDLAMQALSAKALPPMATAGQPSASSPAAAESSTLALRALAAGCDIALYCAGLFAANDALLRGCPTLTAAASQRLQSARAAARRFRIALRPLELDAERARLLA